jgi:hypothetical protein
LTRGREGSQLPALVVQRHRLGGELLPGEADVPMLAGLLNSDEMP